MMERRSFLVRSGLLGCSAAASPWLTPLTLAAAPWDARLVVIILRGAMDGLDVVRPVGDRDFAALRPKTFDVSETLPLDGFFGLHPELHPLLPLWTKGELSFAHAVSTPYRDRRSHFDGQDLLEAGTPGIEGPYSREGWLNRLLATVPGLTAQTGFAVGADPMPIMAGRAPVSRWSPQARFDLGPQAQRLLEITYHDDPLFRETLFDALDIARDLPSTEDLPEAGHIGIARFAARRLRQETRIAAFSINGWDTHRNQTGRMRRPLARLSDTLLELQRGLGADWEKTAVLAMTEFGRTADENGSGGTDHGTGGAMIMAGGSLRGGRVLSEWPGLGYSDLYAGRDLTPTRDVRAYAAWIMRGLFGLDKTLLETTLFPDLEMGANPNLLL